MRDTYIRKAKLVRVIDGDTVELDIDLGFMLTKRERVRVLGVNCPEVRGEEKEAGIEAKLFVMDWFETNGPGVTVQTLKDATDGFGRYLADIIGRDVPESGHASLSKDLIASGHAVPYSHK